MESWDPPETSGGMGQNEVECCIIRRIGEKAKAGSRDERE
jgi:hypothetical protein